MLHNLLSAKECDHLIEQSKPFLEPFLVLDREVGRIVTNRKRNGTGHFLARGQDETIRQIEARIAAYTSLPAEHGQGLHVLQYTPTQTFLEHVDYRNTTTVDNNRVATVLLYLNDMEAGGGETVFPRASEEVVRHSRSSCGVRGLVVAPKRGDALLFYGLNPDGSQDPSSLHLACPPRKGLKWAATKLLWQEEYLYHRPMPRSPPGGAHSRQH